MAYGTDFLDSRYDNTLCLKSYELYRGGLQLKYSLLDFEVKPNNFSFSCIYNYC